MAGRAQGSDAARDHRVATRLARVSRIGERARPQQGGRGAAGGSAAAAGVRRGSTLARIGSFREGGRGIRLEAADAAFCPVQTLPVERGSTPFHQKQLFRHMDAAAVKITTTTKRVIRNLDYFHSPMSASMLRISAGAMKPSSLKDTTIKAASMARIRSVKRLSSGERTL